MTSPAATSQQPQVFRSTAALVGGWAWMVFATANLVDIALRGRDLASLTAAAVLLTGCGIAYVAGIRPKVAADAAGVRVRNPFRDADLPWPAVEKIDVTDAVRIHYADGVVRAWALPSSPRARAKAARRAERDTARLPEAIAKEVRGRTPTGFAVEQLNALRDAHAKEPSERAVVHGWSALAVASLTVPLVLLLITIVINVAS